VFDYAQHFDTPTQALDLARPETPVRELGPILEYVPRLKCQRCGNVQFWERGGCRECDGEALEKVPGPAGGEP
jgi:hypothetical protein